jgi:hypothetical protein
MRRAYDAFHLFGGAMARLDITSYGTQDGLAY